MIIAKFIIISVLNAITNVLLIYILPFFKWTHLNIIYVSSRRKIWFIYKFSLFKLRYYNNIVTFKLSSSVRQQFLFVKSASLMKFSQASHWRVNTCKYLLTLARNQMEIFREKHWVLICPLILLCPLILAYLFINFIASIIAYDFLKCVNRCNEWPCITIKSLILLSNLFHHVLIVIPYHLQPKWILMVSFYNRTVHCVNITPVLNWLCCLAPSNCAEFTFEI